MRPSNACYFKCYRTSRVPSLKPSKSVARGLARQFASTLNYWKEDNAIHQLASA